MYISAIAICAMHAKAQLRTSAIFSVRGNLPIGRNMQSTNLLDNIGGTPLIKLERMSERQGSNIFGKIEFLSPGLSTKDRMVKHIVEKAEREGKINKDTVLIDGSSGNTGASIGMVAAAKGLKSIVVCPEKVSQEKIDAIAAFGTKVVKTPTVADPDDPNYYPNVAKRLVDETPNSFYLDQYMNLDNVEAHYLSTGPEIWEQSGGEIALLCAGVGTAGTISGAGKYLKEQDSSIHVLGVDTVGSIYTDYFYRQEIVEAHNYLVEGVGEDFIPPICDFDVIDDFVQVSDKESFLAGRMVARTEALLLGGSSGAAFAGLEKWLADGNAERFKSKNIVVICPDSGVKYLSKMYNDNWMREQGFLD